MTLLGNEWLEDRQPNETTEEQFARLPVHARHLIQRLSMSLRSRDEQITELTAELKGDGTENSTVRYRRNMEDPRPLPERAYLEFRVGTGDIRVMIQKDRKGVDFLDVSGDSSLVIRPSATNSIRIDHVSRF
jgi:hypothetical protein